VTAPTEEIEVLFHPHLVRGVLGDRHSGRIVKDALPGFAPRSAPVAGDPAPCETPVRYGFRSFDRQWIIPDNRVLNRPNPELWASRSDHQIYLTAFTEESPSSGPAVTFSSLIPDLHHYKGSFGGRAFPLFRDAGGTHHNWRPSLLSTIGTALGMEVTPEDMLAYVAAVAANPAYTARFQDDLSTPGLRVPIARSLTSFVEAVALGRRILWLHTFGERMEDTNENRPGGPPRLPEEGRPYIPERGEIPDEKGSMPDSLEYDSGKQRLHVGSGYVENVPPAVWSYEISGKHVLVQWFSYRRKNRERPIIGDRRQPSPLGDIQPDHWLPEYTSELINVLNVLGLLVELEPQQAELLNKISAGPLISNAELEAAGAFILPPKTKKTKKKSGTIHMFEAETHDELEAGEVKP
jgi:hypothetical protein